jgi:hypothetical protein
MKSQYKSSKSVGKNQTVPISVEDPRLAWNKIGQTKARQGAEIDIVGLDGKSLIVGGAGLSNPSNTGSRATANGANGKGFVPVVTLPPMDGQPPKTYPGGSGPFIIIPTNPENVTASWSGEDLVVNFNWTYTNEANLTVTQFILEVTADGVTRRTPLNSFVPNKTGSSQTVTLTKSLNRLTFGLFRTNITSICVLVADPLNNISQTICSAIVPTYVLDLPVPVITLTSISNGYTVAYTTPTQSSFDAIDIWEIESTSSTAPTITYAVDGITPTNYKRSYFNDLNPANVITQNYNKRWVIARFSSSGGTFTAFCNAQTATPTSPISVDNTPPNEVDSVTASWSGDNINIEYSLPGKSSSITNVSGTGTVVTYTANNTFNAGDIVSISAVNPVAYNLLNVQIATASSTQFTVSNAATGSYVSGGEAVVLNDPATRIQIELTAPNSLVGYFYRFPTGFGLNHSALITKRDLLDQFGEHYSSFTGILRSIDPVDNRTSGVSFNVATRANPLNGITPTLTLTPLTNGYSVFATNYATSVGVNYMEVYAKHTPWVGDPTNDDYVVYAGANPAVIIDEDYTTVYVKVRYYDDFNNTSLYSIEDTVVPLGPADITSFETPISFGTNGVIYAGGDYQSGHRTVFKTSGIFAYDSSSTSPLTGLTTQIVSNASAGTPTFITTSAQIADWNITDTKIENTLDLIKKTATGTSGQSTISVSNSTGIAIGQNVSGTGIGTGATVSNISGTTVTLSVPNSGTVSGTVSFKTSTYTGLSASGPYAFWAGSKVTGANESSKFTVTHTGEVTAREITIIGNGDPDSELISAGGLFSVKNDGTLEATGATLTGTLYGTGGEFTGNIKLNGGSLYALGTGGTVSSGIRTIFNSSGVAAYNSSGGYAQMLTTPLADGSVFATTAANIGGWSVDTNRIFKTSISGKGNILIDSTNGYIAVSNSSIVSSMAGINSPANSLGSTVFWAGGEDPDSTSNPFRVTIGGKLFSTSAEITGTISSIGALGRMTMDGTDGYMSLKTGATGPTSYLIPRNNNIYLTAPSLTEPWSTGKEIASSGPTNAPYISAGSSFKDYWNNSPVSGVGMYTGDWDYFTLGASKPFITASTTGIQLSVSPELGLLLDGGTLATGDKLNPAIPTGVASMLFYTAKRTEVGTNGQPVYSPDTEYGAWASFTNNTIKFVATSSIYEKIDPTGIEIRVAENTGAYWTPGSVLIKATSNVYQEFNSSGIRLQSTNSVYQEFDGTSITLVSGNTTNTPSEISAYGGGSKIIVNGTKVSITGIPRASAFDMDDYRVGVEGDGSYRDAPPLGYPPRQRMVIEDPVSGEAQLGMAVYYLDNTQVNTTNPSNTMGVQGDLVVVF